MSRAAIAALNQRCVVQCGQDMSISGAQQELSLPF
jgi:hypothetical protein